MEPNNLYIPVNIKTRFEFFDGYGMTELISTIIIASVSGFFALIIHTATNDAIMPILIVLVAVAASVMALEKGENNMSMIDHIKSLVRFSREQRQYPYYYTDEWSDAV
ncbi:MAG: hypothetical protein LBU77_04110 [Clostridiales bacterium]|nr:hypothetical protein [Clostridiales bacterium]